MEIMATFIGADNSLGYKKGQVYRLRVEGNSVIRLDGTGYCSYRSLRSFLRNWTGIRMVL